MYLSETMSMSPVIESNLMIDALAPGSNTQESTSREHLRHSGSNEIAGGACYEGLYNPIFLGKHLSLTPASRVKYVAPVQARNLPRTYSVDSGLTPRTLVASAPSKPSSSAVRDLIMLSNEAANRTPVRSDLIKQEQQDSSESQIEDRPLSTIGTKNKGEFMSGRTILGKLAGLSLCSCFLKSIVYACSSL